MKETIFLLLILIITTLTSFTQFSINARQDKTIACINSDSHSDLTAWLKFASGKTATMSSNHFLSADTDYSTGFRMLLKTIHGGQSWTSKSIGSNRIIQTVFFFNSSIGYDVGIEYLLVNSHLCNLQPFVLQESRSKLSFENLITLKFIRIIKIQNV